MYIWVYFLSFHLSGFFYWLKIWFRFFFSFSFLSFFFFLDSSEWYFQAGMLAAAPSRWWGGGEQLPGISPVPIASPFLADKIIIIIFLNSSVYLPTPMSLYVGLMRQQRSAWVLDLGQISLCGQW